MHPLCATAVADTLPAGPVGDLRIREFNLARDVPPLQRLADICVGFRSFDASKTQGSRVIVLEDPYGLAGALHSVRNGTGVISRVDMLVVEPAYQGQGWASALFRAYLADCESSGVQTVCAPIPLEVSWGQAAEMFLEARGFRVTGHDAKGMSWQGPMAAPWQGKNFGPARVFSCATHAALAAAAH